jgi:hypothetical protein
MVDDAYVNHIPVLTGGSGRGELREFYSKRFIPQMPPDTEMTAVSRTIGDNQIVDEMIFKFTHTIPMDWMLPGISPTGQRVEVPEGRPSPSLAAGARPPPACFASRVCLRERLPKWQTAK